MASRSERRSPSPPVIATGTAQAFELVEPQTERRVELVVGTGQLIRVDEEFSSLFVANPEVADIEVKSPRLLYLTGVGVGETTLFAVDDNDNVLMSTVIRVTHNIDALQEGLAPDRPGRRRDRDDGRPVAGADRNRQHPRGGGERRAGREPVRRRPDPGGEPHEHRSRRPR